LGDKTRKFIDKTQKLGDKTQKLSDKTKKCSDKIQNSKAASLSRTKDIRCLDHAKKVPLSLIQLVFSKKSLLVEFILFICVEYQFFDILFIVNLHNN